MATLRRSIAHPVQSTASRNRPSRPAPPVTTATHPHTPAKHTRTPLKQATTPTITPNPRTQHPITREEAAGLEPLIAVDVVISSDFDAAVRSYADTAASDEALGRFHSNRLGGVVRGKTLSDKPGTVQSAR